MSKGHLNNDSVSGLLPWLHWYSRECEARGCVSSLCLLLAFTSGAGALGGSFASLSLEWLSVSESEELSESLVLPDSELLECADATLLGWDCKELQGHHEIKLESSMAEGYLLIILTWQFKNKTETPCFGTEMRGEKAREIHWHAQKIKHQNIKLLEIIKLSSPTQSNM